MQNRKKTSVVCVGPVKIGAGNPISIQSMTKVHTYDVSACLKQINQLHKAGCQIIRCAVPTAADTAALKKIIDKSPLPVVADIHFSPDRAIEALEAGAVKIRLNPGNIKTQADIFRIIDAAKMHKAAIRIGVNEASIRDLKKEDTAPQNRIALMLKEMRAYVKLFEKRKFDAIVLSAKSSDTVRTIEINRALSANFDYPLHLGLTHAGLPQDAKTSSAIALGTLLAAGIGDTIRVSAAGDPVQEIIIAKEILTHLQLIPRSEPELIVCPTCGRAEVDVVAVAQKIRKVLDTIHKPLRIAVMGCIVNGPGEAADADVAVCCGKDKAFIYRQGQKIASVPESKIVSTLLRELKKLK